MRVLLFVPYSFLYQWTWADACRHKNLVMEIAATSSGEGNRFDVAVSYDMLVRCAPWRSIALVLLCVILQAAME